MKNIKFNLLLAVCFFMLIVTSCNSNSINGTWQVSNADNNAGIASIGLFKLLQQETPISFKFSDGNKMEILNKNGEVIDHYNYKIDKNNSLEISQENGTPQKGQITFLSKKEVKISFPGYSYSLAKK